MAHDLSKRIPGFIEPFRVDPRSSVKLTRDFDQRDLQTGKLQLEQKAPAGAAADPFETQAR